MSHESFVGDLPFVKLAETKALLAGTAKHNYWSVHPSGRYGDECCIGHCYALEFIYLMRNHHKEIGPEFLVDIARAQPNKDQWTGVENGFWLAISEYVAMGRTYIACGFEAVPDEVAA